MNRGTPWIRFLTAVLASWPATLRAGLLIVLATLAIVAIGLLVSITVGPVQVHRS
ncbi:hypothetical protein [Actinocrispum sp. NPDC049592]|uniref:hypothetical protein n=1 Tax=Actinocrispum sp. NPDC049592 TaxID=3154835 RepID=UPI00341BCEF3